AYIPINSLKRSASGPQGRTEEPVFTIGKVGDVSAGDEDAVLALYPFHRTAQHYPILYIHDVSARRAESTVRRETDAVARSADTPAAGQLRENNRLMCFGIIECRPVRFIHFLAV